MYFARLAQLKPAVEAIASREWADFTIGGETVQRADRVLDVRQGELCWIVGTVFMDMPLKPCILDDISKEHWIAAPPPREKFISGDRAGDLIMLEDESGRLRLTGRALETELLVTGCIVAVLGTENKDGDFEVLFIQAPDLAPQPDRYAGATKPPGPSGKLAIVSGLAIGTDQPDPLALDLLLEYLLGESASSTTQSSASQITRLIIAGNSLGASNPIPSREEVAAKRTASSSAPSERKYGYDASAYNAGPTDRLDAFLSALLPSLPVTLIPGSTDPTHTALPQPPIHAALLPRSRAYMPAPSRTDSAATRSDPAGWLDAASNPAAQSISGWNVLATGGQNLNDMYKYVAGDDRVGMLEAQMKWRLIAPTAPDTLWCYPFQTLDQFVVKESPHVYLVGDQPRFETRVVSRDGDDDGDDGVAPRVRVVCVPQFADTGEVVLLDLETLKPEVIKFGTRE